jgi:hypothetical protein
MPTVYLLTRLRRTRVFQCPSIGGVFPVSKARNVWFDLRVEYGKLERRAAGCYGRGKAPQTHRRGSGMNTRSSAPQIHFTTQKDSEVSLQEVTLGLGAISTDSD